MTRRAHALGHLPLAEPQANTPVDVLVESPLWADHADAQAVVCRAIATAATVLRALPAVRGEVSVVLTDDTAIRVLNRTWREIDKPTNVLSFPVAPPSRSGERWGRGAAPPPLLGDIVIAYETAAREAAEQDKPFSHHLAHLVVHGFVHLIGYDHDSDKAADEMECLEAAILARLDVPDPYALRERGA